METTPDKWYELLEAVRPEEEIDKNALIGIKLNLVGQNLRVLAQRLRLDSGRAH